jgi:glycosyltransferase involved in cell wall biosynthesis
MQHIVIINQQYPPEVAATGQIFRAMAEHFVRAGDAVTVVTGTPYYPGLTARPPRRETMGGVAVHRLPNTTLPKKSFLGKLLNLLTFEISLLFYCLFRLKKTDTVLVATAPPMAVLCAALGKALHRCRVVMTVQDLYPDVLAAGGLSKPSAPGYRLLHALMRRAMRTCDAVAAISTDMQHHLETDYGLTGVRMIPNLFPETIARLEPAKAKAARGWQDKLVVQYSGNFGVAHEYQTLLGVVRRLKDDPGICFQVAGAGRNYDAFRRDCEAEALPNITFEGYAPLDRLEGHLGVADLSVVVMNAAFRAVLLPSKYYGILASGRAVLLISGCESDIARDIEGEQIGLCFDHGEAEKLADALRGFAKDREAVTAMGVRARALYEARYAQGVVLEAYYKLLHEGESI